MKISDGWPEGTRPRAQNGPGRPEEDHFARRMEIYQAVAPLVGQVGARELTMRQAAEAAHLSVGGLYYYFSSKRELLLFPVLPGVCVEFFRRFRAAHRELEQRDPRAFLDRFIAVQVESIWDIRPAFEAALQLGVDDFWDVVSKEDVEAELRMFLFAIQRALGPRHDPELLAAAIRRHTMSAILDPSITREEALAELRALIYGEPLRRSGGAAGRQAAAEAAAGLE